MDQRSPTGDAGARVLADGAADGASDVRARIVTATVELIAAGGRDAATTRAVSAAAGVQPPTIYRHFGDMRGLLDAAARDALTAYVRRKAARKPSDDPVEDLRRGWDLHVAFGLENPAVYALIYGDAAEGPLSAAAREGEAHLHALVERVAVAGRLRVGVAHGARLIAAAGHGVTLALLAGPKATRDMRLSSTMREAVLAAVTLPAAAVASARRAAAAPDAAPGPARVAARAVALRSVLSEAPGAMTPGEERLLDEWLGRLAGEHAPGGEPSPKRVARNRRARDA